MQIERYQSHRARDHLARQDPKKGDMVEVAHDRRVHVLLHNGATGRHPALVQEYLAPEISEGTIRLLNEIGEITEGLPA